MDVLCVWLWNRPLQPKLVSGKIWGKIFHKGQLTTSNKKKLWLSSLIGLKNTSHKRLQYTNFEKKILMLNGLEIRVDWEYLDQWPRLKGRAGQSLAPVASHFWLNLSCMAVSVDKISAPFSSPNKRRISSRTWPRSSTWSKNFKDWFLDQKAGHSWPNVH